MTDSSSPLPEDNVQATQACCRTGIRGTGQPLLMVLALAGLGFAGTAALQQRSMDGEAATASITGSCSLSKGCCQAQTQTVLMATPGGCCSHMMVEESLLDEVIAETPASALEPENIPLDSAEGVTL